MKQLPINTILYPSETPHLLAYDEWKMKQQNPTKSYRTFKKTNESSDEDEKMETTHIETIETKRLAISTTSINSIKAPSTVHNINVNNNNINNNINNSNNSNQSIRMTVSAAPTVATLINQHQSLVKMNSNSNATAACSVCSRVSLTNLGKANANYPEQFMIFCATCESYSHPVCLELNPTLVKWQTILDYKWQCMQCKTCSKCQKPYDEDKMMFCDRCDRGFHTYCVGLSEVPGGSFFCKACEIDPKSNNTNSPPSISSSNSNNNNNNNTPTVNRVCIDSVNSNLLMKTPVIAGRAIEKATSRTNTPRSEKTGRRGRPLGSLNKPKDPNSLLKKNSA